MKKVIKFGIIPFLLISLLLVLVFFLLYSFNINKPASEESNNVHFVIESGQGVKQIGQNLEDENLIRSQFWFDLHVWFSGVESDFKAGEYLLNTNKNIQEVVAVLTTGIATENEITIQIIEGWTLERMGEYFEERGLFSQEEWLDVVGRPRIDYEKNDNYPKPFDFAADFDFLEGRPDNLSWEGYLFPDTYRVYKDAGPKDVAWRMISNLDSKLTPKMKDDLEKQGYNIHEVLTMASLIEKEVQTKEDMRIASGIFWDKHKNGNLLRSCATLAYILGVDKPRYSYEDTMARSYYNTYVFRGLPPGPISNPGLQAIEAAIYPRHTSYKFFLSRPDTGETVFSEDYSEHQANKSKYLD